MKKKTLVSAVLAATIMGTASVSLAAENMFSDVPLDHWAYDAVAKLAEDGIIEGYGDTNFGGDKPITRYEMAQLVEKAMQNQENARSVDKAAIEKLQKEFDSELKGEVQDLRKDVNELKNRMGWYGDARVRYFSNKEQKLADNYGGTREGKGAQFEQRLRLGFWAKPAEHLSVDGRLKIENTTGKSDGWGGERQNSFAGVLGNQGKLGLDKLSLIWDNAGTQVRIGRNETSIGQGLIYWENPIDGVDVTHQFGDKVTATIGYGDTSAATWAPSTVWSAYANVKVQASPVTSFTLGALHNTTDYEKVSYGASTSAEVNGDSGTWVHVQDADGKDAWVWKPACSTSDINAWTTLSDTYTKSKYKMNQISLGFNSQLAPKWNLIGEYVRNNVSAQKEGEQINKNGFWTRLTYGDLKWDTANTWKVFAEYFSLGNASLDSKGWPHRLNIAGGNADYDSYGNGTKGYGLAFDYQLARNTNLELAFYKLKPYNKTTFENYNNVAYAALSYSF